MMILLIAWGRWLSWTIFYGIIVVNLALDAWLLRILHKQTVKKRLPGFVSYIFWDFASTALLLGIWIGWRPLYVPASWWAEIVTVVLLVAAVRESLLRIFKGFESVLRRWVLVAIAVVVLYSAWRAVHLPFIETDRMGFFFTSAEFTLRWCIAGVTIVSVVLMWFIDEPAGTWEDAIIVGAALASMGFVIWSVIRSFFGARITFFAQYLPVMGYFMAAHYWIRIFARPVPEFGFKELGIGPEEIRRELSLYRELVRELVHVMRKPW